MSEDQELYKIEIDHRNNIELIFHLIDSLGIYFEAEKYFNITKRIKIGDYIKPITEIQLKKLIIGLHKIAKENNFEITLFKERLLHNTNDYYLILNFESDINQISQTEVLTIYNPKLEELLKG